MPGTGIMVNFTAVEPHFNANRFSNANHSDVFSWMVTDSRGKTQTFPTFDFKDHPTAQCISNLNPTIIRLQRSLAYMNELVQVHACW